MLTKSQENLPRVRKTYQESGKLTKSQENLPRVRKYRFPTIPFFATAPIKVSPIRPAIFKFQLMAMSFSILPVFPFP